MAELQLVQAGLYSLGFGGDTLNTAWYVKAIADDRNVNVEYLTAVGSDQPSKNLISFLEEHEIGTRFVEEIADRNVGLYLISLTGAERNFTYWRSASAAKLMANDEQYLRSCLSQADVIYFSGITLAILEPEHRDILLKVLHELKSQGTLVAFDSNARRKLWPSEQEMRNAIVGGYGVATLAMPTFDDDHILLGDMASSETVKRIANYGVEEIVVKDSGNTCLVLADGKLASVSPNPVDGIVDTTGAGDSFNAGYIAARMTGYSPLKAAKLAHLVAGRVICGRGALLDMELFSDLRVNSTNN